MVSVLFRPSAQLEEMLIAELSALGTTGIVEEEGGIRAFFDEGVDQDRLTAQFSDYEPKWREEEDIDWERATREAWPPIIAGPFFLAPPWCEDLTPPGLLRLPVYPGMACGTGRHPATQLALQAIGMAVRAGDRVADIGTGSGILAWAAALAGAAQVVACDVDFDAVSVAKEHLDAMLFTGLFAGSANALRSGWADVVIANIDAATIEELASEFERIRKPDSRLILTGFPESDVPDGFLARQTLSLEGWSCWVC